MQLRGQPWILAGSEIPGAADNEVITFTTARGRSSSPSLNPVLLRRAITGAMWAFRLVSTWTSTLFQPPDLGTRLTDDDPLLGAVVRPLRVGCRLIIVLGAGGQQVARAFKSAGWTATLWWSSLAGRKYDLNRPRARGYLGFLFLLWSRPGNVGISIR